MSRRNNQHKNLSHVNRKSGIVTILFLLLIPTLAFAFPSREKIDYTVPENLKNLVESGKEDSYILIDVRTDEEYQAGHIPTAINIPFDVITENLPTEDTDALIIVYCRSGRRSGIATEALAGLGYTQIQDFAVFENWKWDAVEGPDPE